MSNDDKRRGRDVGPCPSKDALPKAALIWEGFVLYLGEPVPCRVVLYYEWTLPAKADDWIAEPRYGYEVSEVGDVFGVARFHPKPLTDLPAAFFVDVIAAFQARTDA